MRKTLRLAVLSFPIAIASSGVKVASQISISSLAPKTVSIGPTARPCKCFWKATSSEEGVPSFGTITYGEGLAVEDVELEVDDVVDDRFD